MKKILFTLAIIACSLGAAFSQDTAVQPADKQFVVLYTVGESWDTSKQPNQQQYFKEHSAHLAELRKLKKIDVGARYSDTGMIILRAKDEEEAKALVSKDLAIQNKLFKTQIFLLRPFYKGCIE